MSVRDERLTNLLLGLGWYMHPREIVMSQGAASVPRFEPAPTVLGAEWIVLQGRDAVGDEVNIGVTYSDETWAALHECGVRAWGE